MFRIKRGGIHPDGHKSLSAEKAIEVMPVPPKFFIPLRQHIGVPCQPLVKAGDNVKKGQVVADHPEKKAPPVHSSTSGKVKEIGNFPHPVFGMSQSIVIESDGKDEWMENFLIERDFEKLSVEEMVDIIYRNGIVGMGGAAFPTHTKLMPPKNKMIDTLIINGAECEPYLTADYRIMVEYPDLVMKGARMIMKILNVKDCFIGIEENKPKAIETVQNYAEREGIKIAVLKTIYPQGGEKMMINAITGKEIPSGKLPMDVGCVVQNVATCAAIAEAVCRNIPLIERIVTVSGKAIMAPKNILARIGTPFKDAIDFCGGFRSVPGKVIMGGPMMGIAQAGINSPIVKATSGILALTKKEVDYGDERPCIRCGRCNEVCTMRLRPNILSILSEKHKHQTALAEYDLLDCVECGCCTYVCPAKRNIVHYIKLSKAKNSLAGKAAV
jgi:electron transport complex protein RnfC